MKRIWMRVCNKTGIQKDVPNKRSRIELPYLTFPGTNIGYYNKVPVQLLTPNLGIQVFSILDFRCHSSILLWMGQKLCLSKEIDQ
ncbi:hypothetical protein U1Q18_052019 [Sarracenia purpurea var. burkii]